MVVFQVALLLSTAVLPDQPRQHRLQSKSWPLDLRHHARLILVQDWLLRVPTRQTLNSDRTCIDIIRFHIFDFLVEVSQCGRIACIL